MKDKNVDKHGYYIIKLDDPVYAIVAFFIVVAGGFIAGLSTKNPAVALIIVAVTAIVLFVFAVQYIGNILNEIRNATQKTHNLLLYQYREDHPKTDNDTANGVRP